MTALTFDPFDNPGSLDVLQAAGLTSPGLFILGDNAGRTYNWDIKKAPGIQGAFMTYRGWLPAEDIVGTFQFWQQGQVEEFYQQFLPLFQIDAKKLTARPVQVYHPILAASDITQLVTKYIGPLTGNAATGWKIQMKWHEFRVAKPISSNTPTGATTRIGGPTVQSELDAAIAAELETAKRPL